jgi:hypothetical protein
MAGEVRATFFFRGVQSFGPIGWSESHYLIGAPTLPQALVKAKNLGLIRAQLLGDGMVMAYIRVSAEGVFRDSQVQTISYDAQTRAGGGKPGNADMGWTCILVRGESGTKQRRMFWIGGLVDAKTEQKIQPDPKTFGNPWLDFTKELIANWGYLGLVVNAANKAPPRVPKPPPGRGFIPRPMVVYPYTQITMRRWGSRKRGRPFDLLRGRSS